MKTFKSILKESLLWTLIILLSGITCFSFLSIAFHKGTFALHLVACLLSFFLSSMVSTRTRLYKRLQNI